MEQTELNAEPAEILTEQILAAEESPAAEESADAELRALLEALVYITDEPLTASQIAYAVSRPIETVTRLLEDIASELNRPGHGLTIREVAGGYKMATKPEYHEPIRSFVKNLKPPMKLSLPALETLAVVAYKQPITAPEIMDIRGVQGAGVLKTLLDRKLIATAGRKQVLGKPILYKTTKEFLIQFGLKDLSELPTLKEFEELGRLALSDVDLPEQPEPEKEPPSEPSPEPIREPDPGEPGDPQNAPIKAEGTHEG